MKKIITTVILLFLLTVAAFAGPFGLEFGMTLDEVKQVATINRVADNKPYMYFITPNKKTNLLEIYRVNISPKYGVYDISAFGYTVKSDDYGEKIKSEFQKIADLIKINYGEPSSKFDFLKSGSIWKESNEWLTSLRKGERVYSYFWSADSNDKLITPLKTISLEINFEDDYSNECFLRLSYQALFYREAMDDVLSEENVF